eukprot:jgi/Psemu1/31532/gm1.31532_g
MVHRDGPGRIENGTHAKGDPPRVETVTTPRSPFQSFRLSKDWFHENSDPRSQQIQIQRATVLKPTLVRFRTSLRHIVSI